jgi:uncharacterized membrane protein
MSRTDIHHNIESTREALGDTVEALAAKTDVKTRISEAVAERKQRLHATVRQAKERMSPGVLAAIVAAAALALLVRRRRGRRR